jgi:hypothetical protein
MVRYACPYLNGEVELSEERRTHIAERHPDLLPEFAEELGFTLNDPDQVRRSGRFANALLFARWFDSVLTGKYVVVVVVGDRDPVRRHWIVTAYISRRLSGGEIEWMRT